MTKNLGFKAKALGFFFPGSNEESLWDVLKKNSHDQICILKRSFWQQGERVIEAG